MIASFLTGIGMGELGIILVIVLVIFGAGKLPKIAGDLGTGIRSFRKAVKNLDDDVVADKKPPKQDKKTEPEAS